MWPKFRRCRHFKAGKSASGVCEVKTRLRFHFLSYWSKYLRVKPQLFNLPFLLFLRFTSSTLMMRIIWLIRAFSCTMLGRYGTSAAALRTRRCWPPPTTRVSLPLPLPLDTQLVFYDRLQMFTLRNVQVFHHHYSWLSVVLTSMEPFKCTKASLQFLENQKCLFCGIKSVEIIQLSSDLIW